VVWVESIEVGSLVTFGQLPEQIYNACFRVHYKLICQPQRAQIDLPKGYAALLVNKLQYHFRSSDPPRMAFEKALYIQAPYRFRGSGRMVVKISLISSIIAEE
jgi:hypothetical protein